MVESQHNDVGALSRRCRMKDVPCVAGNGGVCFFAKAPLVSAAGWVGGRTGRLGMAWPGMAADSRAACTQQLANLTGS